MPRPRFECLQVQYFLEWCEESCAPINPLTFTHACTNNSMVCRIAELAGLDILYLDARKEEIDPHADAADSPIAEVVKLGV